MLLIHESEIFSSLQFYRQLVLSRDRIANGLKKLLETNDLVVNMEVRDLCTE